MQGSSLAAVLVMVVVLGGLAAIAVIGVNSLTGSDTTIEGLTTTSAPTGKTGNTSGGGVGSVIGPAAAYACKTNISAANAASAAYYANRGTGAFPTKWTDLTGGASPLFEMPADAAIDPRQATVLVTSQWRLVMAGDGSDTPTFTCKPPA
jgi:hypothetical protein